MIVTRRLTLIAATLALARAELDDRAAFADLLGAAVPETWPPESTADALPLFLGWLGAAPDKAGWFGWYALCRDISDSGQVLVGGGGFLGPPEDGVVQSGVTVIAAETEWANPASVRVLGRAGFVPTGAAADPAGTRFELRATPS